MDCEHQLLETSERRAVTRRNYVIGGCMIGQWKEDANIRLQPVLEFMLEYLREVFRNCVAKLTDYAEVSSVQKAYVALNDDHGEIFLDDKSKVQAFVEQRNPKPKYKSTRGIEVDRDLCEDSIEYSLDSELLWQALNMNKNAFHDESLKQLLQSVEKMHERLGYLYDPLAVERCGPTLVRSLADGFIHLTEQYGPALKVVMALLNTFFQDDHMRCVRCTRRWSEEAYQLATKCSGWEDLYTAITNAQSFPPEVKHLARMCLNDIHPNDFCVLLMSMGRSALVERWKEVLNAFATIKRTGNGGVNLVLLMISLDLLVLQQSPFYLQETTLVPTASGTYRALVEKWPSAASLKPQHVWIMAKAYTDMMKNTCNSVSTKLKERPNGSTMYSTNTPLRKKINGKNLERMAETFAAHLKNITGRSEYARVCLSDTGFKTMVELFGFVTSSSQSYYDLFILERKKGDTTICSTPNSIPQ
uniref:Uncharacterized protein n=1 Tax=Clandestinovirus TaxID=2831644 RepID=A0A8F8PK55_9VIRU|nr:hypothetical protein KOM_12_400 [Clandestinovirus]